MNKKKSYLLLIVSLVLLAAGTAFCIYTYKTGYTRSKETGALIKELKAQKTEAEALLTEVEAGTAQGDSSALKVQAEELDSKIAGLSKEKLALERPYSYSLIATFLFLLLLAKGIKDAVIGVEDAKLDIKRLAQAGLCAALCYIGFAFFKIDIPVGTEKTAFHFGNVFCVLAALLLGGYWGGLAGAVGMTIGDLTTTYVTSAPKTFFLKLCIGLITGLIAHKIFKLSKNHTKKYVLGAAVTACIGGMAFNIVADPLVGYFYKMWLLGIPQDIAEAFAKMAAVTTSVNAVIAVIAATVFYLALRPALKRAGLFVQVTPESGKKEAA